MGISKSANMKDIPEERIHVIATIRDKGGSLAYLRLIRVGQNTSELPIYEAYLETNYQISSDRNLTVRLLENPNQYYTTKIELDAEFDVRILIEPEYAPPGEPNDPEIYLGTPTYYRGMFGITKQFVNIKFGIDTSTAIYNITTATWSDVQYVTYPEDVFETYPTDVYLTKTITNPDGTTSEVIDVDPLRPGIIQKIHSAGDTVMRQGQPVIKFAKGSIKRDEFGNPITLNNRRLTYYVESMMFDARLYASEAQSEIDYINQVSAELS